MRTTERGTLSELRIAALLIELGCRVSRPIGHDTPYDLVAERAGRFSRVQVKTARGWRAPGVVVVQGSGGAAGTLTADECDVILAWDEARGVAYAVPPGAGRLHLRTAPAANGQGLHIRRAADYELRAPPQLWPAPLVIGVGAVRLTRTRAKPPEGAAGLP